MTTREITIQGVIFPVSQPYAEGHTCTEAEAHALNQTRAENIRNNMAKKVKAEKDKLEEGQEIPAETLAELAAEVRAYDEDYIFTMASAGGGAAPKDPIAAEAFKLAKAAVAGKLKGMGVTVKAYTETAEGKAKYDNAVAQLADSDAYQKAAKKAVAERSKLAEAGVEELAL